MLLHQLFVGTRRFSSSSQFSTTSSVYHSSAVAK